MLRTLGTKAVGALRQGTRNALRTEEGQGSRLGQQKRHMSGGDDDGIHRVAWWDAPQNPDIWKKHHLAWWTTGFYVTVYWLVAGGSKKEAPKAA